MKPLIGLGFGVLFPALAAAGVAGDYAGMLDYANHSLHVVFHVRGPDDALTTTTDSPDQHGYGYRMDSITLSNSTLRFAISLIDARFIGDINANGAIVGTFTQNGVARPLVMTRADAPPIASWDTVSRVGPVQERYHDDRTGVEFDFPPGWSVRAMQGMDGGIENQAVLRDTERKATFISVAMFRRNAGPQDIPKILDKAIPILLARRAGMTGATSEHLASNYRIRPGSVEHSVIGGQRALRAIGEMQQDGKIFTELLTWIEAPQAGAFFFLKAQPANIEVLQPKYEQMIQSALIP